MNKLEITVYVLIVLALIAGAIAFQYAKAVLFYDGDLRCVIADCRINK